MWTPGSGRTQSPTRVVRSKELQLDFTRSLLSLSHYSRSLHPRVSYFTWVSRARLRSPYCPFCSRDSLSLSPSLSLNLSPKHRVKGKEKGRDET